ncbi:hypothetical protein AAIR98_001289 [Elusimicrobium simillimum]|uniref:hypothetical protein n=1 Tax=Elusimicrobium simillimum TaxID=3143438 RepID=UPI003C6FBA61
MQKIDRKHIIGLIIALFVILALVFAEDLSVLMGFGPNEIAAPIPAEYTQQ